MRLAYTSWRANGRGVLMGTQHLGRHGSSNIWWNLKIQFLCEYCRFSSMASKAIRYQPRCWFQIFLEFSPRKLGHDFQFDLRIFFQMGWFNHQLEKLILIIWERPPTLKSMIKKHGKPTINGLINGYLGLFHPYKWICSLSLWGRWLVGSKEPLKPLLIWDRYKRLLVHGKCMKMSASRRPSRLFGSWMILDDLGPKILKNHGKIAWFGDTSQCLADLLEPEKIELPKFMPATTQEEVEGKGWMGPK